MFKSLIILQIETATDLLSSLAKTSPLIALLVAAICYLMWKLNKSEDQLASLNKELRESEKTSMSTLSAVNSTLEKVMDDAERNSDEVVNEIKDLREWLKEKLVK